MPIFKDPKSLLELTKKDTTLLSLVVLVLFIENAHLFSFNSSLINDKKIDFEQLFHFKFIFGFFIFIFSCKFFYFFYSYLLIPLIPILKGFIINSYKLGLGCFVVSVLLFYHAYKTNDTNCFYNYASSYYKIITVVLGFFCLFIASICDWSNDDDLKKQVN